MTHAAYVFAGYATTTAALAAYAGWIISRRRAVARLLAPPPGPIERPPAGPVESP